MNFMATQFPEKLLAKTREDISNNESLLNRFLDTLGDIATRENLPILVNFKASIATYNSGLVMGTLDNTVLIEQIYMQTVKFMLGSDIRYKK